MTHQSERAEHPDDDDDWLDYANAVDLEITVEGGPVPDDISYSGTYIPFKDQDDEHDEEPHNVRWHP